MRLAIKTPLFFFSVCLKSLRKAYGISSEVNDGSGKHYLLFDCDTHVDINYFLRKYPSPIVAYDTPHGNHVIVFEALAFPDAVAKVLCCPYVDKNWVSIAIKRGYFFLETPPFFSPTNPSLKLMKIER